VTTLTNVDELEPLVAAAASGDADAFGRIISVTSGLVSSVALAILRDVDQSQEVAQDVFLSAWRDLKKLRNPASFLPWLRQMTRNRAHHVLRSRVRGRRWIVQLSGNDDQAEAVADSRGSAADHLLAAEQRAALRAALAALPEETREVLTLYYREGQSAAQVASLLELSEDAVKKRLSRARASLRGTMLERFGETLAITRPTTAFTLAVMTALPLAMPPAASAATVELARMTSAAATKSGGLWPWVVSLFMPVAGIVIGALGGLIGVVFGIRGVAKEARDERERRELRRFLAANVAAVLVVSAGFQLGTNAIRGAWFPIANFAAFNVVMLTLHLRWLPRILERRRAAEMAEDPVRARRRRQRDRMYSIVGWVGGLGLGWLGLFLGLLASHKL
jgi:RNA polymerase sigma factor (sigma-70 family)